MTTHEQFVRTGEDLVFIRHTELRPDRPTLLFVHGLGDSGLCFTEVFSCGACSGFNLIVPDQVGYGRSSQANDGDYSLDAQIARLRGLTSILGVRELTLIGHSLGGIVGSLWAEQDTDGLIRRLVNVEGNLTAADATFSKRAALAFGQLQRDFGRWRRWFLSEFTERFVLDELGARSSLKRYYGSLLFARPEPFLANSLEIMERSRTGSDGVSEVGRIYGALGIPKIYFWGEESLSAETRAFLETGGLLNRSFAAAGHWPMIDASEEFYPALAEFIAGPEGPK